MKKITIILISFLLFASGFSQAQKVKYPTRKGVVQESTMIMDKNGKPKKKPLQGVRIFTGKGVSNSSNAKGEFTLKPDAVPFKIIQVKKNEYTLLSPEQGTRTYYDNNEILDVLMVSTKTFNSRTDSNTKTATKNNEKKKNESLSELEKRKDRGEITTSEYIRMHDSITKVYSDRLQTLIKHCEESAKRWFMGQEIIDQEIDEAIIKGEFDKAVSLIESKGTTKQRTEEIEKSKAAYENHKKLAQQHDEIAEKHKEVYESQVKSLVRDHWNRADIKLMEVKYSEALAYLDSARVLQEEHFGLQDPDLAATYNNMGFVYNEQDNSDKAMEFYNKALKIREQVLNPLSPDLAATYNNKGVAYWNQGKYEEALKWLDKALEIREKVLDPLSPDLAISYISKGVVYWKQGKNEEALKWYDKALEIQEKVLDSLHPDLATSYNNKGSVYFGQGKYEEALKWYDKALEIQEKVLDPLHHDLAKSDHNKGSVYQNQGKYEEALKWIDKALEIKEKVLDPLSPALATSYNNKGLVYGDQGKYEEALKWIDKALEIREKVLDPLHPELATTYASIGLAYVGMKNYEEALEYLEKALPGCIKSYGEENENTILLKQLIEYCKQALGK